MLCPRAASSAGTGVVTEAGDEEVGRRALPRALSTAGPLLSGIFYFGVLTPLGLVLRLAGRDPLRLRRDPAAPSYWIARAPASDRRASMRRQS